MANLPSRSSHPQAAEVQRRARATWEAFCEDLKQAGRQLVRDDLALDSLDAAEGLRYLSRLLRTGLERHVEGADPADVHLHSLCDERIKGFGGDNPGTRYFGASISSGHAYRLSGDFSGCSYFTLMTTGFDAQGAYRVTGSLDGDGIPGARTGPVEIAIQSRGAVGDGGRAGDAADATAAILDTTPETKSLLVRCTFDDAAAKAALRILLVRVDLAGEIVQCAFEPIAAGLLETAKFVRRTAETWTSQSVALRKRFNQLPLTDPERIRRMGGDPNIFY